MLEEFGVEWMKMLKIILNSWRRGCGIYSFGSEK
jgi:hypothetical protein